MSIPGLSMSNKTDVNKSLVNYGLYVHINQGLIKYGLSEEETVSLIKEIVSSELVKYSRSASLLYSQRVEKFAQLFFAKTLGNPRISEAFSDPAFQFDCFEACNAYGKTGSETQLKALVELLAHKLLHDNDTLLNVAISECIKTIPKLTVPQMHYLALLTWLTFYGARFVISNRDYNMSRLVKKTIQPLLESVRKMISADVRYLQYTGCVSRTFTQMNLTRLLQERFESVFRKQVPIEEIEKVDGVSLLTTHPQLFAYLGEDKQFAVLNAFNRADLENAIKAHQLTKSEEVALRREVVKERPTEEEVDERLSEFCPTWRRLKESFEKLSPTMLEVSSVGSIIGTLVLRSEYHLHFEIEDAIGIFIRRPIPISEIEAAAKYFEED